MTTGRWLTIAVVLASAVGVGASSAPLPPPALSLVEAGNRTVSALSSIGDLAGGGPTVAPTTGGSGSWASVAPAGDLDGDGVGDLTAWSATGQPIALSGRDGARLSVPGAAQGELVAAWTAAGRDLDGDGRPDLLRLAITDRRSDRTCNDLGTCNTNDTWTWVLSSHRSLGSPSSWRWTSQAAMAAEDNESTAQGAVQPARSWEGVGDRLEVRLVGDGPSAWPLVTVLSTKGRTSAGINSFVGQFVSRVASRHEEQVTAASMHALDRLGRTASSRALEPSPTREMYLSLGDLDADGSGEVVVTTSSADSGRPVTHTVMDAELDVRWAAGADQGARLLRAPDDAGRSRVALVHPGLIEMRQGADGTRIWTSETRAVAGRSLRGEFEASIYHLTTDPSADGQGSDWHLRLDPIDLRTGLAAGTGPTIELGSFGGADAPGSFTGFDVDGDGKLDLVSQGQGSDGMGGPLLFVRRTGDVARGPVTTDAQPLAGLQLDATPGQEVVWLGWSEAREQWDEVFASRPGQRMWLVPLNRWERMVPLSVDGITHFAEVTVAQDGTPIARLLDGGTLEPRWTQSLD